MTSHLLLGRYRLLEKLGSSNMSQTYLAEDISAGDAKCVIKKLVPTKDEFNLLMRNQQLFEAEAKVLEELGHYGQIPSLQAYFEEDAEFYLVQDFIDGIVLEEEITIDYRWTEAQAVQFLQEILTILTFVHEHNVIHRDIKPSNILRRRRDGRLVLIDFGAVKQVQVKPPRLRGQTSVAVIVGTPGYMPAEQANGRPQFSSDIYAVGIIAIQALTGLLPKQLREDDDGELVWRDRAEISDRLAEVLTRMVRLYFKHRYQDATEALAAVKAIAHEVNLPTDKPEPAATHPNASCSDPLQDDDPSIHGSAAETGIPTTPAAPPKRSDGSTSTRTKRLVTVGAIATLISSFGGIGYLVHAKSIQSHQEALAELQQLYDIEQYDACIAAAAELPDMHQNLALQGETLLKDCQVAKEQATALKQIQTLADEDNYADCIEAGQAFPGPETERSTAAVELLSQCQQQRATELAQQGSYVAAINAASEVVLAAPNYSEAQTLISQWSYRILELAEEKYQKSGDIEAAKAFIGAMPESVAAYASAQQRLPGWELELKSNQDRLNKAQTALDESRWQEAIDYANQVTTTYFRAKAKHILDKANSTLDTIRRERDQMRRPLVDVENVLGVNSPVLPSSGTRYHEYEFQGQTGKTISIMMESEDFDPYLYLVGPDGELVATNDDRSDGAYSSAINIPLEQTGTYRIQATAYSTYDRGQYNLVVRYLPE